MKIDELSYFEKELVLAHREKLKTIERQFEERKKCEHKNKHCTVSYHGRDWYRCDDCDWLWEES